MKNRYYYTNSRILAQDIHSKPNFDRYFYLHDRLGSVRQVLDETGEVVNSYTYQPFGDMFVSDANETVYNPFKFTGQWYDDETGQYYLRARQYDPFILRFTGRDPVKGKFGEPLTLHRYLYCINEPVNHTDLSGKLWATILRAQDAKKLAALGIAATVVAYMQLRNFVTAAFINMTYEGHGGKKYPAGDKNNVGYNIVGHYNDMINYNYDPGKPGGPGPGKLKKLTLLVVTMAASLNTPGCVELRDKFLKWLEEDDGYDDLGMEINSQTSEGS